MDAKDAVIYTRVSQDPTGRGRSVASQEAECVAWCEREGWHVLEVLTDNDLGASRWSGVARPEYERLKHVLAPGMILVTWEASRAQRDLAAYVALRDLCAERNVEWAYSGRVYDLTRGDDRFNTGLDALLSEKEADQTRERVLRGKRAAALEGRPPGRPPYGYRRIIDPDTGATNWEPIPEQAAIIREVTSRLLQGDSLHGIANDLNRRAVPTGKAQKNAANVWRPHRLRMMFDRPTYAGLRTHQKEIIGKGIWPAIIDEDEWHRVRGILDDPTRRIGPGPQPRHLLSSLATCGVCGAHLRHFSARDRVASTYACSNKQCVSRRAELVDDLVEQIIVGRLSMPDAAAAFDRDNSDDAAKAVEELNDLRSRLDSLADQAADGKISAASFARMESRLLPQIEELESRATASSAPEVQALITAEDVKTEWDRLPIRSQREIVRALVEVVVHKSTLGTRIFNPEDIEVRWKK